MFKMRLGWYAGVSTALAGSVVISAFHQRANFYSAMVYLAQSNFCLLVLINFILLLYSSFIYALTQLCFGTLRAIEIEQLTERAWFAITETCLAMTIFREEIGAWFLVMFTALVTGKVWGWIGDGRVEFLEQQPPPNPRLFHLRLSVSLTISFIYDVWLLRYCTSTVIQTAKRSMMVMFLFEFAVLATTSGRTAARYLLCLAEQNIIKNQTKKRLHERREEVRSQREDMIRQRARAAAAGEEPPNASEPLPDPDDVDEMDIEVPGWVSKGEWVLWLDLLTDMIKLGIYVAFFLMLLTFYGLPFHIMRDLFMTTRDFLKRLNALLRYRRAIQEMNEYPDATEQDLANENTCIICREEMHHWVPARNSVDRVRPKKLPCGHILHLGCLKSWLERQQVCPTCRRPVAADHGRAQQQGGGAQAAGLRIQIGGFGQQQQQQPQERRPPVNENNANNGNHHGNQNQDRNVQNDAHVNNHEPARGDAAQQGQNQNAQQGRARTWTFGPIRVGFGTNGQQVRELAQRFGIPNMDGNQAQPGPSTAPATAATTAAQTQAQQPPPADNIQHLASLFQQAEQTIQREIQTLQATQQELLVVNLLVAELQRLRQRGLNPPENTASTSTAQPSYAAAQYAHLAQSLGAQHGQFQLPLLQPGQQIGLPPAPGQQIPPLFQPSQLHPTQPGLSRINTAMPLGRFAQPSSQSTMQAGHPSLPDGLVLPPGWTLTPLQRLESGPTPHPQSQSQHPSQSQSQSHPRAPTPSDPASTNMIQTAPPPVQPAPTTTMGPPSAPHPPAAATVPSPSPVMPNWGGSAQLFASAPHEQHTAAPVAADHSTPNDNTDANTRDPHPQPPLEHHTPQDAPAGSEHAASTSSTLPPAPFSAPPTQPPHPHSSTCEPSSSSSPSSSRHIFHEQQENDDLEDRNDTPGEAHHDKGKGRAVTLEEATDNEDTA